MSAPRPVVLVHGALHGAWCWAGVQAELDRRGIPSYAVDLPGHGASTEPLTDLHGDADAVARLLERLDDEVVLVGHSYGGAVIGQAGLAGRVSRLVFLTALVVEEGQSAADAMAALPAAGSVTKVFVRNEDRTLGADPQAAVPVFYGHCPPELAAAAVARLSPQRAATLRQPATVAAWRHRPTAYIRCLRDEAITPAMQDALASRCDEVHTLDADHSPFLAMPDQVAEILAGYSRR